MYSRDEFEREDFCNVIHSLTHILNVKVDFPYTNAALLEFDEAIDAVAFAMRFQSNKFLSENKGEEFSLTYEPSLFYSYSKCMDLKNRLVNRKYVFIIMIPSLDRGPNSERWFATRAEITAIRSLYEYGVDLNKAIIVLTSVGEPLFDVVGGYALRNAGFIVLPQEEYSILEFIPGVPDLIALKLGRLQNSLRNAKIIEFGAISIEFDLYGIFGHRRNIKRKVIDKELAAVVEVKGASHSGGRGHSQLESYLSSKLFDYGILICPGRLEDQKWYPEHGIVTWKDNKCLISLPKKPEKTDPARKKTLINSAKRYLVTKLLRWTNASKLAAFDRLSLAEIMEEIVNGKTDVKHLF